MRSKNVFRILATVALVLLIFPLISCDRNADNGQIFLSNGEFDYLTLEFSDTSYAWLELDEEYYGDGKLIYDENVVYLKWIFVSKRNKIEIRFREGDEEYLLPNLMKLNYLEAKVKGKQAEFEIYLLGKNNAKRNEILSSVLKEGQTTVLVNKMTSEEWQQWMRDHSLDPDSYVSK